ncbi:enoyl-ACP reductase [Buchnera aphidicola (Melanaphis sacchari)]|uniref:Enoyl-[acyl-carrier-protein] reductase [NADH] n=1 Tax=Buchnera aphidicola (Melanaphis sacchari) TaxID=2173854 RepID=A0A2U8DG88_9GAMM|nr:enoyl-ACP reductase [Buchnera aphidicola]AWH90521.1 enoyl-ACP reductase [Buchnera aphidicola (Melanaphis sacchari)]
MKLLEGKKILITGILNERSIALGIAKSMYEHNAELIYVCQNKKIANRVQKLIKSINNNPIFLCDVSCDKNIKNFFLKLKKIWKKFDGFVHSIAFCPKKQMQEDFIKSSTRESFIKCHEISSYSFLSMARESQKMLNNFSSLVTLSYLGAQKAITNYNIMGLAKASLESNVRYMASILGKKNIRVNAISPGPIKTISSRQIKDFCRTKIYHKFSSCTNSHITSKEVGNVASFLCSNLSIGITGSIIYVDHGVNIKGVNTMF